MSFDWLFSLWETPKLKYPVIEPFKWYHNGPWWEHPIYNGAFTDKK